VTSMMVSKPSSPTIYTIYIWGKFDYDVFGVFDWLEGSAIRGVITGNYKRM